VAATAFSATASNDAIEQGSHPVQEHSRMNRHAKPSPMIAALLGLLLSIPISAQAPLSATELAPGVLVSSSDQAPLVWVADASGRVTAVDLDDGEVRWRGPAEGLPLALIEQQLVVLARPDGLGKLSLQLVDPNTGSVSGGVIGELPPAVLASPDAQPNRIFAASADTSSGTLRIRWSYSEWPLQGAMLPLQPGVNSRRTETEGVISVDFSANRVQAISDQGMPARRSPDLLGAERLNHLEGTQMRAADDAFVQVSTAVADDVLGTQWRWSLHERTSGRAVGNLVLPYASAPFLLRGNQLLWRSEPLTRLQPTGDYQHLGARLVAQALTDGRELWSVDLLDRSYRDAPPP
jgi:hypothetical protein